VGVDENLFVYQEGLCSMELVTSLVLWKVLKLSGDELIKHMNEFEVELTKPAFMWHRFIDLQIC
jgi:hypothetical protein